MGLPKVRDLRLLLLKIVVFCIIIELMKRTIITILVFLIGMTVFAQSTDMSYYTWEYNRTDATFASRLGVLEIVRAANLTEIGEFYHDSLKVLLARLPDARTREEREAADASARILCQGLLAEKYVDAASDLWLVVQNFDVVRDFNDGLVMQDALVALGQLGNKDYVSHIVLRLDNFNTHETSDVESKRRIQRGVAGAISALEAFHEPEGFSPIFFASIGWYDPAIRAMASNALRNIIDDPGEIISVIIQDTGNNPNIKYDAWREMLLTGAPNTLKAKVAAVALATGWSFATSNPNYQRALREMRMSAIDTIRVLGVEDDSVYANLEKSYSNSFVNNAPDYDEIRKTIDALSVTGTDEAVQLLYKFLQELHARRLSGVWGAKERQVMQWLLPSLGATRTQNPQVRQLITAIERSNDYTGTEQSWARDALRRLGQ